MIYLDYAAQTPVHQEVLDVFNDITQKYIANPNAAHALGKEANEKLVSYTNQIATCLQVKPSEIIYTSGATEANNLAIKGIVGYYKRAGKHIITTYLEHSSVTSPIAALQREGYEVDFVDILPDGQVDLDHLQELLRKDTVLVSIAYVDSELGIIQPVEKISEVIKQKSQAFFHVDATQAVGKIPVCFDKIDLITLASHKIYGINGCGLLIKKEGIMLEPLLHGGVSTTAFRSGTPTMALIAATAKALALAYEKQTEHFKHVEELKNRVLEELKKYKQVLINTPTLSSPYILNISFKGIASQAMQEELGKEDIYVATKSACCTLNTPSRPVYALTKDRKRALSTLRISLSHLTTKEEIECFLQSFDKCYHKLVK